MSSNSNLIGPLISELTSLWLPKKHLSVLVNSLEPSFHCYTHPSARPRTHRHIGSIGVYSFIVVKILRAQTVSQHTKASTLLEFYSQEHHWMPFLTLIYFLSFIGHHICVHCCIKVILNSGAFQALRATCCKCDTKILNISML